MESKKQLVAPSKIYKSAFDKWDKASWVRAKPHQEDLAPFQSGLQFFSEDLAILFQAPVVRKASAETRSKLLAYQLFVYLEFTVWLEMGPVNEVCDLIRREDFLPWLPQQMKSDAIKIYVDEAGHAEMSHALIVAVEKHLGISKLKNIRPAFLMTLDKLIRREEPEFHSLIKLFFVIISETLITGTLIKLPKDETVQAAVRAVASDHASDEGRHHAYFRAVFEYVWPRLPREVRRKIGVILPDMILAFLQPDVASLTKVLQAFPHEFPEPRQTVEEIVYSARARQGIRDSAAPTMKMLKDNGVFEERNITQAFERLALLSSPSPAKD
jgi:hypothetical protein